MSEELKTDAPEAPTPAPEPVVKKPQGKAPKAPTPAPQPSPKNEVKLPSGLTVTYN